jgi:hypothetical protein
MTFHVQFDFQPQDRERLVRFLHQNERSAADGVKFAGRWLAIQSGTGFAILETDDAGAIYALCSAWSDYGQVNVTPVVHARDVVI